MWTLAHLQFFCIRAIAHTSLYIRSSPYFSPTTQRDLIKYYPSRPHLYGSRIFLPKSSQDSKKIITPCTVVSVDYNKSPKNKFPAAYEDVIAQVLAIIEDGDIPIDESRVVLCRSSAGGISC